MSNKCRRLSSDDRISNLHGDILSHILSSLPTRDVFRTSVLSKQWRYNWRYAYTMDVDDGVNGRVGFLSYREDPDKKERFVRLMRMLLFFSLRLTSFSLGLGNNYDSSQVHAWISTLLRHSLENLHVKSDFTENGFSKPRRDSTEIVFPCNLLVNSTGALRTLNLYLYCTINVAVKNCAANLTTLCLSGVDINVNCGDHPHSTTVTFCFPVLETLTLKLCRWLNVKLVEIDAPSLTTFESSPKLSGVFGEYQYSIKMNAPRLANLWCKRSYPEKISLSKGSGRSSIISAVFNSDFDMEEYTSSEYKTTGLRLGKYIDKFKNLEELELSDSISKIIPWTSFLRIHDKLRRLKLNCPGNAEILFQILRKAPLLKFLGIDMFSWNDDCDYERSALPTCIMSHLEEVELNDFDHLRPPHMEAAKLFMKNGKKLNILRLCIASNDRQEAEMVLSAFPKLSPSLRIEVVKFKSY